MFGFRRFVSKRGDDRKSEKMLQIVNLSKNPRLILRSKPKNFQNASKRLRIRKSWSNVLFLILSWSCPVVNNSFLNLDLHFRRWTTARRATMFPNPKEKQKNICWHIYRPHRHCNRIAGWIHRTMFFWKQPNRLFFRETPSFSSTNHIVQKFLVEWRSRRNNKIKSDLNVVSPDFPHEFGSVWRCSAGETKSWCSPYAPVQPQAPFQQATPQIARLLLRDARYAHFAVERTPCLHLLNCSGEKAGVILMDETCYRADWEQAELREDVGVIGGPWSSDPEFEPGLQLKKQVLWMPEHAWNHDDILKRDSLSQKQCVVTGTVFRPHNFCIIEGSLEVKLPTIWTDEKQRWEESEKRREEERKSKKRKSEARRSRCAKR